MAIYNGSSQVGRIFFGVLPVREVYEGSRKIMGFENVTPNINLFVKGGNWSSLNGSGSCSFSIPDLNSISGSAVALNYCDDIVFNTYEGGIVLTDVANEYTLRVYYLSESQGIGADVTYIVVSLNNTQVAKVRGGGFVNTRIRAWYDISTRTLKVQLDDSVIYTSGQIEWRPWKLSINLGFFYYPPTVVPGYPPILIDGIFVGGWVTVYQMNRAVGYPQAN